MKPVTFNAIHHFQKHPELCQIKIECFAIDSVRRLILIGVACGRYYQYTWSCQSGGELVRVFFLGQLAYLILSILFMAIIVRHSAKGSIMDSRARKYVQPLLTVK